MESVLIEVIACSVIDAVEAERGGANRLEVINDLESGGLTPPLDLVRQIIAAVKIPVRVMLRESPSYTVSGAAEADRLCAAARSFANLPVDGLVLGFLRDGEANLELTNHILSHAPSLKATFHRAFEETADPIATIDKMKSCQQIDRILTAGGDGKDWAQKIARLAAYERAARPEITILAGGGLDETVIQSIRRVTPIREYHVGRTVRVPQNAQGAVRAARVRRLINQLSAAAD